MNGLEQILEGILSDAKAAAQQTLTEAQEYADKVRQQAEAAAAEQKASAAVQAETAYHRVLSRQESADAVLARRILLQKKQQLIMKTLDCAYQNILTMPDADYFNFLETLLHAYAGDKTGEVQLSAKDLARVTSSFRKAIKKHHLTLSEKSADIDCGFLLVYGEITENCSMQALFRAERDRLQDVIRAVLFPQENANG